MPDFTAWPVQEDFDARLGAFGATLPAGLDAEELIAEAVTEFERRTKWSPFLAEKEDSETAFDSDGGSLDLRGGYVEVTTVTVDISFGSSGRVLTAIQDYSLMPAHAAAVKRPFTDILFETAPMRGPGAILVTGKRGYCTEIPKDAWYAVLNWAVREAIVASEGSKGTVTEYQQDTVRKKFSSSQGDSAIDRLGKKFDSAVARYKRVFC